MVDTFFEEMNILIVPFGKLEALEAARSSIGNWDFTENAHDYTIGATALILDVKLVTNNVKHFQWMDNVVTPTDVMQEL